MVETVGFWKAAGWRAVRTWAQTVIVLVGGDAANAFTIGWPQWLFASLGAAAMSILTSIVAGIPEATEEG